MQWNTVGDVDIDIGANPSAEEAEEGVESTDRKVVDIIESFRLNVRPKCLFVDFCSPHLLCGCSVCERDCTSCTVPTVASGLSSLRDSSVDSRTG